MSKARRESFTTGFSLVEILMALSIVGALTSLAMLVPGQINHSILRSEASDVVRFVRRARQVALEEFTPVTVRYDSGCHCFRAGESNLAIDPTLRVQSERQRQIHVRFQPSGESDGAHFFLISGSAKAEIRVDWLTGRVVVQL